MGASGSAAPLSRRWFLAACGASMSVLFLPRRPRKTCRHGHRMGRGPTGPHPTPRPGITGEKVLTHEQLGAWTDAIPAFDEVRQIPQIVDGIRCHCGCADQPGFYSLLSCYEGEGMARACDICQGQGRLAYRLFRGGRTLDQIRAAIDARFG